MSSAASSTALRLCDRFHLQALPIASNATSIADDVRRGLTGTPKTLPPKYFYDDRGSRLFDEICVTREYYPTRTERALLTAHARSIIERTRPATLIELGSGFAHKSELLLSAARELGGPVRYVPIDVSEEPLRVAGERIVDRFDDVEVHALVGDYAAGIARSGQWQGPRLFVFLGGSIGNFEDGAAVDLLSRIRGMMQEQDAFLLGADRVKDVRVLDAAYNDAAGITAEFNRNVLRVINAELDADFDPRTFAHDAFYDVHCEQIEMHLRSQAEQTVTIRGLDLTVEFAAGESIRTEISRKFTPHSLGSLFHRAGMRLAARYEPDNEYFSLALARRR